MFGFRRRTSDDLTHDQRERLQIVTVAGSVEIQPRWEAKRRLEFARTLLESGRIGQRDTDDDA